MSISLEHAVTLSSMKALWHRVSYTACKVVEISFSLLSYLYRIPCDIWQSHSALVGYGNDMHFMHTLYIFMLYALKVKICFGLTMNMRDVSLEDVPRYEKRAAKPHEYIYSAQSGHKTLIRAMKIQTLRAMRRRSPQ